MSRREARIHALEVLYEADTRKEERDSALARRDGVDAYAAELTRKYGVEVFPVPDDIQESDFVDGHHMIPAGAARYSKWLADTHIKPWFDRVRKQP